jgi:predicted nucleic acid-binding protein
MRRHEAKATAEFLDALAYYETTRAIARRAGELKAVWSRKGHTLALPDVLIAAVALEHGLALATADRQHFPMPELKLLPLP